MVLAEQARNEIGFGTSDYLACRAMEPETVGLNRAILKAENRVRITTEERKARCFYAAFDTLQEKSFAGQLPQSQESRER